MTLLFLQNWFSTPVARAIGWTLIHSLWQGLLLTVIAGIVILGARHTKPGFRYAVLSGLFCVLLAGVGFTFILEWRTSMVSVEPAALVTAYSTVADLSVTAKAAENSQLFFADRFAGYFNEHASLIVAVWFLFFIVKAMRLSFSIGYAQRIRYHKVSVNGEWQQRVNVLAGTLAIRKLVSLRESAIVKIPVVIGFFKPVILLPFGLLSNLPADQVEAILLHELAHIKRRDYLFNLLQCFAETILFFNPAVLWLSARIRQEREHCCDDMAISVTGNKSAFVQALVAFHEYEPAPALYAPAFPGEKYYLLHRVKRIITNNNKNLNNMEKIFLTIGLVVTGLLTLAFSSDGGKNKKPANKPATEQTAIVTCNSTTINILNNLKDTVPEYLKRKGSMTGTIDKAINGKRYKIDLKDDIIIKLEVDDNLIPPDKINDYKEITDKIIAETKEHARIAKEDADKKKELAVEAKIKAEISKEENLRTEEKNAKPGKELEMTAKMHKDLSNERMIRANKLAERDRVAEDEKVLKKIKMEKREKPDKPEKPEKREKIEKMEKLEIIKQKLIEEREIEERHKELAIRENENRKSMEKQMALEEKIVIERKLEADGARKRADADKKEGEKLQKNIIADLLDQHIIQQSDNLTFELSDNKLIVNGVEQPEEVHQRFKTKYGIASGRRINFARHSSKQ